MHTTYTLLPNLNRYANGCTNDTTISAHLGKRLASFVVSLFNSQWSLQNRSVPSCFLYQKNRYGLWGIRLYDNIALDHLLTCERVAVDGEFFIVLYIRYLWSVLIFSVTQGQFCYRKLLPDDGTVLCIRTSVRLPSTMYY